MAAQDDRSLRPDETDPSFAAIYLKKLINERGFIILMIDRDRWGADVEDYGLDTFVRVSFPTPREVHSAASYFSQVIGDPILMIDNESQFCRGFSADPAKNVVESTDVAFRICYLNSVKQFMDDFWPEIPPNRKAILNRKAPDFQQRVDALFERERRVFQAQTRSGGKTQ